MVEQKIRYVESAALFGCKPIRCTDGTLVHFVQPKDDGEAGVHEPARPKPGPPPLVARRG